MVEPALRLEGLTRRFGGVIAVDNVSLAIPKGEVVGLVGPNGAGKTTLVNLVTGFIPKTAGRAFFEGADITRLPPHEIARAGVARTFQIVQPFSEMTVLENVMSGALFAGQRSGLKEAAEKARYHLEFVGLAAVRKLSRIGSLARQPQAARAGQEPRDGAATALSRRGARRTQSRESCTTRWSSSTRSPAPASRSY